MRGSLKGCTTTVKHPGTGHPGTRHRHPGTKSTPAPNDVHIPILRHGVPYTSLDKIRVPHHRTSETFAEMSQVNGGIIRRELSDERQEDARQALARIPHDRLLEICSTAADHFLNETLAVGDTPQTPADYVEQLSATTGMPKVMVRRNMAKIAGVMKEMRTVLRGLTRGLDSPSLTRVSASTPATRSVSIRGRNRWASSCRATLRASTRYGSRRLR